jgi:aromatic ring-opening dioxygenase catalytic subunit (LigB family)
MRDLIISSGELHHSLPQCRTHCATSRDEDAREFKNLRAKKILCTTSAAMWKKIFLYLNRLS